MRSDDELLIDFCRHQYKQFDRDAWLNFENKDHIKVAILFLYGVDWYKRKSELKSLFQEFNITMNEFPALVKSYHFDCARFSSMLRWRINYDKNEVLAGYKNHD
jgi:hypothetical protein